MPFGLWGFYNIDIQYTLVEYIQISRGNIHIMLDVVNANLRPILTKDAQADKAVSWRCDGH